MIDEKVIADLKAQHGGNLHLLEHMDKEVIVKVPDRKTWDRFQAMRQDEDKKLKATRTLVMDCVVYPDSAGLEALLNELPAITDTFAGEIIQIAGGAKAANRKKL